MPAVTSDYPLAVVGGGPAGAACALAAAAEGLEVLLCEARVAPWDTVCGEGVMPSGVSALDHLGLWHFVVQGRAIRGVRYVSAHGRRVELDLPRPGAAFLRPALHAALYEAIAESPRIHLLHGRVRVVRDGQAFRIEGPEGGTHRASSLALAEGRQGACADALGIPRRRPRRRGAHRFGLRARFEEAVPLDRVQVHLGRGCELYLTPLPGGLINAAALYPAPPPGIASHPAALFAEALRRHPSAARHLGEPHTPPAARSLSRPAPRDPAALRLFLVGDAAGSVDPVLGCGLAIALAGGIHAARGAAALAAGRDPRAVAARHRRLLRREIQARRRLAGFLLRLEEWDRGPDLATGLLRRFPGLGRPLAAIAAGHRP